METTITVSDLYEASYYYLNKSEIQTIECTKVNGKISCSITFVSANLPELQANYFQGNTQVNLFDFRRAYSQLNGFIYEAKKKYRKQEREQIEQGGVS